MADPAAATPAADSLAGLASCARSARGGRPADVRQCTLTRLLGAKIFARADGNGNGLLSSTGTPSLVEDVPSTELRAFLCDNPDVQQRMTHARQEKLSRDWDELLGRVEGAAVKAEVTRTTFSEMWADSNLGGDIEAWVTSELRRRGRAAAGSAARPEGRTVRQVGRVDYGVHKNDQLDEEERERSMQRYQVMLAEVEEYNQRTMGIIASHYDHVLRSRVLD
eukprot:gene45222-22141_t